MKKILAVVLTFTLILTCLCVNGSAETQGDFEYTVKDGEAIVTEYVGSATDVTIPSTLGGVPVTTIAGFAFYSTEGAGVPSTAVSLHIPESVTTLEYGALYGCNEVTAYTVSSENSSFKVVDGVLFSKDGKTLVRYPAGRTDTTYTIPQGVTTIEHYAFANCEALTAVEIPAGVITIGERGFYSCRGLTEMTIPDGVTSIGEAAFWGCSKLATINFPDSLLTIGEHSFEHCGKLTSLVTGNGVTIIGQGAFSGCEGLTTVVIGDNVTTIGTQAFYHCRNLATLTIGKGVTTIGKMAFDGCEKLTSLELPYGLTTIERDAFFACDGITAVTVPSTVTTIGTWSLGYVSDGCTTPAPGKGFVIKGVAGSAAETYALENKIPFEAVTETDVPTPGDVNDDGEINAKDALQVLRASVGKFEFTVEQKVAADVNKDEKIDAKDALEILKFAVKKPSVIGKPGA